MYVYLWRCIEKKKTKIKARKYGEGGLGEGWGVRRGRFEGWNAVEFKGYTHTHTHNAHLFRLQGVKISRLPRRFQTPPRVWSPIENPVRSYDVSRYRRKQRSNGRERKNEFEREKGWVREAKTESERERAREREREREREGISWRKSQSAFLDCLVAKRRWMRKFLENNRTTAKKKTAKNENDRPPFSWPEE